VLNAYALLGPYIDSKLSFHQHADFLQVCAHQKCYHLQHMRNQCLIDDCLHVVLTVLFIVGYCTRWLPAVAISPEIALAV